MMITYGFGSFQPLWQAQAWAARCLISTGGGSGDARWAILSLTLHGLAALQAFLQSQLTSWARNVIARAMQGARFAAAADTTLAAGGSQARALFREIGSLT
jgi:hypothetical protein